MIVNVVQESQPDFTAYASIPIAFDVRDVARIVARASAVGRVHDRSAPARGSADEEFTHAIASCSGR